MNASHTERLVAFASPRPLERGDRRAPRALRSNREDHVGHILAKLDLRDRVQVVAFAYEIGLVQPSLPETAPVAGNLRSMSNRRH